MTETNVQGYVDKYRAKDEGTDSAGERGAGSRISIAFRQWCEEELKPLVG